MSAAAARREHADDEHQLAAGVAPFTQVPNALLRDPALSPETKIVAALLLSYAWGNDRAFPAQKTLAANLGRSVDFVQKRLDELEGLGYIERQRRPHGDRRANAYVLNRERWHAGAVNYTAGQRPTPSTNAASGRRNYTAGQRPISHNYTAGQRHQQDAPGKTQGEQHQRHLAVPHAVVEKIRTGLHAWGVAADTAERLSGGLLPESVDRVRAWIAAAPDLNADPNVANVAGLLVTAIEKNLEPPPRIVAAQAKRVAAEIAHEREAQVNADREAAKQREGAEVAQVEKLLAALPPLVLSGLERRVTDELIAETPGFLQRGKPSQGRVDARKARLVREIAADEAWLAVVDHDELSHAQHGEPPAPAFSARCAGCVQVRDFVVDRKLGAP